MVEFLRIGYTRAFEVRMLHHFWLDEGATVFDQIADPAKKAQRLLSYDVRRLLSFEPSTATAATITGLRGVFRTTGLGFLVAVPRDAVLPLDAAFEFFVTMVTPDYANYTAQALARPGVTHPAVRSLSPQPIVTVVGPKSGLPFFLHQGDVPSITPPAGSTGAPAFGIELNDDSPPNVTAIIRLAPRRLAGSPFNFAEVDDTPHPRVFEVYLQNRWTT